MYTPSTGRNEKRVKRKHFWVKKSVLPSDKCTLFTVVRVDNYWTWSWGKRQAANNLKHKAKTNEAIGRETSRDRNG